MAKQNSVTLGIEDCAHKTISSAEPVQSWARTKLVRMMAILTGSIRGRYRHQIGESYTPRRSPDDDSRLEFQRFLYW